MIKVLRDKPLYRGLICAVIISVVINMTIILGFLVDIDEQYSFLGYLFYAPAIISGVIVYLLTVTDKWKSFFMSILFMFISFLITTFIIEFFDVIMFFHQIKYGKEVEMSNGIGLVAVMTYLSVLFCTALGSIVSCIITAIRVRKAKRIV